MKKILSIFICFMFILTSFTLSSCDIVKVNNDSIQSNENKNAYELAVENGFEGDISDWLASLVGNEAYKSIYDLAVEQGIFTGTLEDFIESLKGEKGDNGSTDIERGAAYAVNSIVSIYCNFTYTYNIRTWGGYQQKTETYSSAGSGVIVKDEKESGLAYIVTNYHVVYDKNADTGVSEDIYIYLYGMEYDGYKISAKYIGGSSNYDIAVLKIESDIYKNSGAYKAEISSSSNLAVGSKVIAIGNPEAEGISVTAGVVSVPNENIETTSSTNSRKSINTRVIRIDAAVNSGNSGGGLFDANGKLIGIVNAKSVDEDIEGMCYAIPINVGYAIADKIINTCDGETKKSITTTDLGIVTKIISSRADYDNETYQTHITQIIAVNEIDSSSVAKSLLKENDILVSITYKGVTYDINNLYSIEDVLLQTYKNDVVTLIINRNNELNSVEITLSVDVNVE